MLLQCHLKIMPTINRLINLPNTLNFPEISTLHGSPREQRCTGRHLKRGQKVFTLKFYPLANKLMLWNKHEIGCLPGRRGKVLSSRPRVSCAYARECCLRLDLTGVTGVLMFSEVEINLKWNWLEVDRLGSNFSGPNKLNSGTADYNYTFNPSQ